jgi:hypothetical protein
MSVSRTCPRRPCLRIRLTQEVALVQQERRRAHNALVEARGAIRVCVRVRPPPLGAPAGSVTCLPDGSTIGVSTGQGQETQFSFGRVFGPSATQVSACE